MVKRVKHDVHGKRQGGPRDHFFPPFLTFAVRTSPFSTRREVENDIALLKEIVARRPSKADEWDDIAEFLSSLFSTENNPVKRMQREK